MEDFNQIVAELLSDNKKNTDEKYRNAYVDGVLDFFNKMKKLFPELLVQKTQ